MSLEAEHVKEEPGCEDYEVTKQVCVKLEPCYGISEAAMLAELYTDHVVKEELVLGPESVQRRLPAVYCELPNVLCDSQTTSQPSDNMVPRQTRSDSLPADMTATDDAGRSQPQPCEFPDSHVYTRCEISESISTLFFKEEVNDESEEISPISPVLIQLTDNDEKFIGYFRLSQEQFVKVLNLIESDIISEPSTLSGHVSPVQKLAVAIRYLATGDNLRLLSLQHGIPHADVPKILNTTFLAICKHLKPIYLPQVTEQSLANVAKKFMSKWNFPNCCGALEGKHCRLLCQASSGSLLNNYILSSVVLIALVDADSKFMRVDIGSYGPLEDSGIFSKSELGRQLEFGEFPFPADAKLPGTDADFLHFVIGGAGFKLLPRLMTPYSIRDEKDQLQSHFNRRLNRARSIAGHAFVVLANTFRVFHDVIKLDTETVQYMILASCCLHNMLLENGPSVNLYSNRNVNENNLTPLRNTGFIAPFKVRKLRNELKNYLGGVRPLQRKGANLP